MPYQSNLLGNLWTGYRQRRATGGRPLVASEMRGLLDPIASSEAQKSRDAGILSQQQSQFDRTMNFRESAYKDQQSAAKMSGITDIAGMGMAYSLGSQRNKILGGLLGGANPTTAPIAAGAANAATYTSAGALGGAGAEGFVPGLMGGGGAVAGPVAAGVLGGELGNQAMQKIGFNEDISQSVSYTAAGALAGAAIGGPVGAAVGGAIGLGVSLIDDIFGGLF